MSAISGTLAGYKTLMDGTLRITVDLGQYQAQEFHRLFPAVDKPVALAPLIEAPQEDASGEAAPVHA